MAPGNGGWRVISWYNTTLARYAAITLLAAIGPMLLVAGAYDHYSRGLIDALVGERLERHLAAISSRLTGFLGARASQLDTLVNYPGIGALVEQPDPSRSETDLRAVVELEADQPDLYGILLYNARGCLVAASPSQAASGAPYWGKGDDQFRFAARQVGQSSSMEVVGPFRPSTGRPGSLLLLQAIPGAEPSAAPLGWIALHVRLASLTELMGVDNPEELFQAVLIAPDGGAFSTGGVARPAPANVIEGAAILPGWRPALVVETDHLAAPLNQVRRQLIVVTVVVTFGLIALSMVVSRRLAVRMRALVDGSQAIAAGDLTWRIDDSNGKDEISALACAFNGMAAQLDKVIRSAVEAEKMAALGRFATSLAHEVRNPLSTMKTTVEALLINEPSGGRRDILRGMDEEIDRLDATLHDLLLYARPRQPQRARVALGDMLERIRSMTNSFMKENGISLVVLGEPCVAVLADVGHLKQIVMNLIINAIQAMPGGGVLTIRTLHDNAQGLIEISDTGTGMTEEVLARVTEPFFTTRHDGTGLGLSISRQLAELNGGVVEFCSAVNEGTTVSVRLPLAE